MRIIKSIMIPFGISVFAFACMVVEAGLPHPAIYRSLETNEEFDEIWHVENIQMTYNRRRTNMVGAPGRIIIMGWKRGSLPTAKPIGLDSLTGETVWTIFNGADGDSIISQGELLYRGTVGIATVQSYQTDAGKLLWSTRLPWAHSTDDIYFAANKIFVHTNDGEFFILDQEGEILNSFSEMNRTFLAINDVIYLEYNSGIKAVRISSKEELWRVELDNRYTDAPIFDDGTIFIRTWHDPPSVYAIDQNSGEILWKISQNVHSNLFVLGEKIYFLSFDGSLVTIRRNTGEEISRVMFSPAFDLDKQNGGYFICGDPTNNVLAVSFGDNSQIMGLKMK